MQWPDRGEWDGRDTWFAFGEEKYLQKLNQKLLNYDPFWRHGYGGGIEKFYWNEIPNQNEELD